MDDDFQDVMPILIEWIGFAFAIVTIPLYCFLIFVIHRLMSRQRLTNDSFYLICCIVGYIDVVCLLNNYLTYLFPKWGLFTTAYLWMGAPLLHISFFISWGSGVAQAHSTLLMAINRLTAMVYSNTHDRLWRKERRKWVIAIIVCPAVCMGAATLFSNVTYIDSRDCEGIQPNLTTKTLTHLYYGIVAAFMIIYTTILIVIYTVIFIALRRHQRHRKTLFEPSAVTSYLANRITLKKRRELRLLFMSLIVCCIQLVVTCYIILKFAFRNTFDEALDIYNFLDIIYCGINPYLLIGFSDVVRQQARQSLQCLMGCVPRRIIAPAKGDSFAAPTSSQHYTSPPPAVVVSAPAAIS